MHCFAASCHVCLLVLIHQWHTQIFFSFMVHKTISWWYIYTFAHTHKSMWIFSKMLMPNPSFCFKIWPVFIFIYAEWPMELTKSYLGFKFSYLILHRRSALLLNIKLFCFFTSDDKWCITDGKCHDFFYNYKIGWNLSFHS